MRVFCEHKLISVFGRTELVSADRFGGNVFNVVLAEVFVVERDTTERAEIHLLIKIYAEKSAACRAEITLNYCHFYPPIP